MPYVKHEEENMGQAPEFRPERDTPCQGGCGKVRSVLHVDSPKDWLCYDCRVQTTQEMTRTLVWHKYWGRDGREYRGVARVFDSLEEAEKWTANNVGNWQYEPCF